MTVGNISHLFIYFGRSSSFSAKPMKAITHGFSLTRVEFILFKGSQGAQLYLFFIKILKLNKTGSSRFIAIFFFLLPTSDSDGLCLNRDKKKIIFKKSQDFYLILIGDNFTLRPKSSLLL